MGKTAATLRREMMDNLLATYIELFVSTKKTEGLASKTTDWYSSILTKFDEYLDHPKLSQVSINEAREFIASLQQRTTRYNGHPKHPVREGGLSVYTVAGYVRTLKVFGKWLEEESYSKVSPFAKLKRPKLPETLIEVLSDQEIERIAAAINPRTVIGARVNAIFLLMLDTGIRASELCTLRMDWLNLTQGSMKVTGKGNKERIVYFASDATKALLFYINTARDDRTNCPYVFLTENGEPLTYNALKLIFVRLARKAQVDRLHPHLLRHSFAVRYLIQSKGDVVGLQRKLGHTDITTTQIYLHLSQQYDRSQAQEFSVVDALALGKRRRRKAA
jgi:site-specific recombinase XerD